MLDHVEQLVRAFEAGRLTRRQLAGRIGAMLAAAAGANRLAAADEKPPPQRRPAPGPTFQALGLNHIALSVTDVARSRDWYIKHLGLHVLREDGGSCFLGCGENFVALFPRDKAGMHHYCYTIDPYEAAAAVESARAAGHEPRRHANRVYFDDPDGLIVQVSGPNNRP